jgi:hypothetical protein
MLAEALALRWDEQDFTEVRPAIFGADQVTFIAEGGTVDFVVDGRPKPLSPGQLAVIPGDVPHSASVPAEGERVVSVNVWRLRARG